MTEYWQSIPRKFCDFCKCWLTNNKPSVDFHEKGRRHQENVKRKLAQIGKQGQKEYIQNKKLEKDMAKMEKAAALAFQKDLQENPELAEQHGIDLSSQPNSSNVEMMPPPPKPALTTPHQPFVSPPVAGPPPKPAFTTPYQPFVSPPVPGPPLSKKKKNQEPQEEIAPKIWYEAMTPYGHYYYWNAETQESKWEAPDDYYTLAEQEDPTNGPVKEEPVVSEKEVVEKELLKMKFERYRKIIENENEEDEFSGIDSCNELGPKSKPDPYGRWTLVPQKQEDLQLPKHEVEYTEVIVPKKEDRLKIKEKTFVSTAKEGEVINISFKKRKGSNAAKRNMRKRDADQDD